MFDKLDIIKNFYKSVGISFDIDKYINDGTIDFEYYDYFYDNEDIESKKILILQKDLFQGGSKNVNICNNGLVTDIPVFIHETSHFRSQPNN